MQRVFCVHECVRIHNVLVCQFLTFEGLSTTFEGSMNVFYNKNLLSFVTIGDNTRMIKKLKNLKSK